MILAMIMAIENEEERSFVENLYHKYQKNMFSICFSVLQNQADAEDALADAFENIMNSVKQVRAIPEPKLPALLHTYAKNAAIDIYRRNAAGNERFSSTTYQSDDGDIPIDLPDESFNIEQIVLDKALIVEVFHLIERFPQSLKSVALLKWHYHYRNNEIAALLNISESAVSTRVQRARALLTKLLAQKHSNV